MRLAIDIGNSQIYGGVFADERLILQFRRATQKSLSSDELGLFFRSVLRENGCDPEKIKGVVLCSVVPNLIHATVNSVKKYFHVAPFILAPGIKTGLQIKTINPREVGADRIANAMGALHLYPNQNLIVIDFGTATTVCVITMAREYLGGVIMPGVKLAMEALESKTAKLPAVEIAPPPQLIGRSTVEAIQSGLFYGHLGMIREIVTHIQHHSFRRQRAVVIGTGGLARMYTDHHLFDVVVPELVLDGLNIAYGLNVGVAKPGASVC